MTLFRVDLEQISTGELTDIVVQGANEDEARREAEETIRRSQTPNDLRITAIATVMVSAVGSVAVSAVMKHGDGRDLYERDTAAWAQQQSEALRRRAVDEIDWDNIAEEIEDLAASEKREIRNRLAVICEHLLKWAHQPDQRSGSWRGSVVEARDRIADVLEESPSLKPYPATQLAKSYNAGRRKAAAETGLIGLPEACPWTIEQLLDQAFWP
jgi:hypothetical protein